MNKNWMIALIFLTPFLANAQEGGIQFEQKGNWKQIVAKAKSENKFIFVDCYTTWCGPCKKMDKEVYTVASVGDFYNAKFITVKMQMDTTAADDEFVKKRYPDASMIEKKYNIREYPSYLVFTADGKLLNRGSGVKTPEGFVEFGKSSIDPSKNYYTLLTLFQQGKTNMAQTSFLARQARVLGDTASKNRIAREYIARLNKDSLLTKGNIEFMREFTKTSRDPGFNLFYDNADSIGRLMDNDVYAQALVFEIISSEMMHLNLPTEPDWNSLKTAIEKKYNAYYAGMVVSAGRSSWALRHHNESEYARWLSVYYDGYGSKTNTGLMASLELNNYAWAIFQSSPDKDVLTRALGWSGRAVLLYPAPNWIDTYANILYKLGRKDEAMTWENTAIKLDPNNKELQDNLSKMKAGTITWPVADKSK